MKLRKISYILLIVISISIVFAGCGRESTDEGKVEDNSSQTIQKEKVVNLYVLNGRPEDKIFFDTLNESFKTEYPNIRLSYDAVGGKDYNQLVSVRMAAGQVDVLGVPGLFNGKYPELLMDLAGQPFLENFYQDTLNISKAIYDEQYVFPLTVHGVIVYYNKNTFNDLGLSVPKTWTEFVHACEKIKAEGIAPIIFGGKDQWPVNMIVIGLEAGILSVQQPDFYTKLKAGETSITDGEWKEILEKLSVLNNYFIDNTLGLSYGNAPGMFAQGKSAMMIDATWSMPQIIDANPQFDLGMFILPGSDNAENNKYLPVKTTLSWCVLKDSPSIDASIKYLEFLTKKENYKIYMEIARFVPIIKGVEITDPIVKEVSALMENQTLMFENLLFSRIPGVKFGYTAYCMEILTGVTTPEEAVKKLQDEFIASKPNWK